MSIKDVNSMKRNKSVVKGDHNNSEKSKHDSMDSISGTNGN